MKIRPVGAELFHADGQTDEQTDMTKLKIALRNFANAPKNYLLSSCDSNVIIIIIIIIMSWSWATC